MVHWWEVDLPDADAPALVRAVAYYRHSAQDRQENSIPIQQDQVRAWANQHGVEIIREFCDAGRSGLNSEDRPAFMEMMDEWIAKRNDFEYVLCLDVSRWGRFQDIDLSAQFSAICKKNKKQVIYTTIGKPKENDPLYPVYVQFERFTNAIAAAVHAGKRVLFVSEKMAALEVVKRRLDQLGLGPMTLELHSHKSRKQEVLAELKATLELGAPTSLKTVPTDELRQTVTRLREHDAALHGQVGETGSSPYQAMGQLLHLKSLGFAIATV